MTRTALSAVAGTATYALEAAQLGRAAKGLWDKTGKRLGNWSREKRIKPSVKWLLSEGTPPAIESSK